MAKRSVFLKQVRSAVPSSRARKRHPERFQAPRSGSLAKLFRGGVRG